MQRVIIRKSSLIFVFVLAVLPVTGWHSSGAALARGSGKNCSNTSTGLTPLIDMGAVQEYNGEEGGLYGEDLNALPIGHPHWLQAFQASRQVLPRDAEGTVDTQEGKIGFISIGMSNARNEFQAFMTVAQGQESDQVILVNGAQAGKVASDWANPDPDDDPWVVLEEAIQQAGLAPAQVQVAWLKQANARPQPGEDDFPVYAEQLREDVDTIVRMIRPLYPNLSLIYFSSRIYAGYGQDNPLNPEPFAYESAFSVRWLIEDQIDGGGTGSLDYNNAPVLLWGPYLWADGADPREDGLAWPCEDFLLDGVHPSQSGEEKVAGALLDFFSTDPLASLWFTDGGLIFLPLFFSYGKSQ